MHKRKPWINWSFMFVLAWLLLWKLVGWFITNVWFGWNRWKNALISKPISVITEKWSKLASELQAGILQWRHEWTIYDQIPISLSQNQQFRLKKSIHQIFRFDFFQMYQQMNGLSIVNGLDPLGAPIRLVIAPTCSHVKFSQASFGPISVFRSAESFDIAKPHK